MTPKVRRRKCAMPHCHRHVHGLAARRGIKHCHPCRMEFRYASRIAREREVGKVVGETLAACFYVPRETN